MNIVCLSQTVRQAGDKEVNNRNVIVIKEDVVGGGEKIIDWQSLYVKHKYILEAHQAVICAEAFYILEEDFNKCLHSMGALNTDLVDNLAPWVKKKAKKHGVQVTGAGWYLQITFGMFASIIDDLIHTVVPTELVEAKEKILLESQGMFADILNEGMASLEDNLDFKDDENMLKVLCFMKDPINFSRVVKEWATIGGLRLARNSHSHPFSRTASQKTRLSALQFFEDTLSENFSEGFRHVESLTLMKIKETQRKFNRELQQETQDSISIIRNFKV